MSRPTRPTTSPTRADPQTPTRPEPKHEYGQGRQKLLAAVARLVAQDGGTRVTLRDLAKEAGLSHNAIYRHFSGVDEAVQALMTDLNLRLREGLRAMRQQVSASEPLPRVMVGWLFDFALAHPDAFVVAMRERHGPSGPTRQTIEDGFALIVADMRADLSASQRLPALPPDSLDTVLKVIVQHSFELCLSCIEAPERRAALLHEAEQVFQWCLTGAVVASQGSAQPPAARAQAPRRAARPGN